MIAAAREQFFESDIRKLGLNNVAIASAIQLYDYGEWSWGDAMTAAVLALGNSHEKLVEEAMLGRMKRPVIFQLEAERG